MPGRPGRAALLRGLVVEEETRYEPGILLGAAGPAGPRSRVHPPLADWAWRQAAPLRRRTE
jgi:hypothetical protein